MSTTAFDTLAAARDMERAGMERPAAEAVAVAIRAGPGELATRDDMDALRRAIAATQAAIRGAIAATQAAIRGAIATTRAAIRGAIAATQAAIRGDMATTRAAIRDDMAALRRDMDAMKAGIMAALYRALWMQAAGIVGAVAALSGIAVVVASLIGTAAKATGGAP